ncbi:MAG: flagellar hook-basal body protein FliE [Thermoleophilia bacterium]|jgi:flagellar hook-basal body complex protein FliE|nr:flagellar hook-basal body protein FliE [Thermoleophilia bacterium]
MTIPAGGISAGMGGGLGMQFDLLKGGGGLSKVDSGTGTDKVGGADGGGDGGGFAGILKGKLAELNASQKDSAAATQSIATGTVDDVAQTMMRIEQASVSMQMATQVRNKVLEAYQEVLRMQM